MQIIKKNNYFTETQQNSLKMNDLVNNVEEMVLKNYKVV